MAASAAGVRHRGVRTALSNLSSAPMHTVGLVDSGDARRSPHTERLAFSARENRPSSSTSRARDMKDNGPHVALPHSGEAI
jgi:hypothetical protein